MREAFSHNQKITLKQDSEQEKEKQQQKKQKKTPVKQETLEKLTELKIDIKNVFYEEDAQALIEEKSKQKPVRKDKKEQILFEATTLANRLEIPLSESVGIKAILDAVKNKIDVLKKEAGHDIERMAEILAYEVSYKAISTDYEVYNNTTNLLGASSLASYNMVKVNINLKGLRR